MAPQDDANAPLTLDALLDLLPTGPEDALPIQDDATPWAQFIKAENPYFVAPPIRSRGRSISPGATSLVVISAPGAVGKTTVAKEIARRKRALYVDLAKRRVGSDSASGIVTNAFGYQRAPQAFADLGAGRFLVVLDALDETRLGSGEENFLAFLEDVARLCKTPGALPSVILFGREDASEWAELWLDGVPTGSYSIDFFDEQGARLFVERWVSARLAQTGMSGSLVEPARRARDEFLALLRDVVSQRGKDADSNLDRLVRSVIGYAPVLEAVGEFLIREDTKNYQRLINDLKARKGPYEWDLLVNVAEHLLAREQTKFAAQQVDALKKVAGATTWSDWSGLYSPDEQRARLLHKQFRVALASPPPSALPPLLRDAYERAVDEQLGQHPFRSHVLFGEYIAAWLLSGQGQQDNLLAATARGTLSRDSHRPTPALGRFLLTLGAKAGVGQISSRDFGLAYESLLSEGEERGSVRLVLQSLESGCLDGEIIKAGAPPLRFEVVGAQHDPLWFWDRLAYADVDVSCAVELGVDGGEFRLGPDVDLVCDELRCAASELRIFAEGSDDAIVAVTAREFPQMARPLKVRGDGLLVRGPALRWPWVEHRDRTPVPASIRPEVVDAYNHLTRILRWFRARGYQDIGRVDDLIDKAAAGGTATAQRLIDFCIERGLIERSGRYYVLNSAVSGIHGINWVDVRRRILRGPVIALLSDFVKRKDP